MAVLDTAEANKYLEALVGKTTYTATVAPIKIKLCTAVGSDAAAGTEVAGGGYVAGGQAVTTWNAAASRQITNNTVVSYTNMPVATVTSVDATDSTGSPVRKFYGTLAASRTTASGDTLSFAAAAIVLGMG
jgi:hypothetical protein